MVRLCFALLLLRKEQDGIDMPRRLMDNLEGEVIGEEIHEGGLGENIFSTDLDSEVLIGHVVIKELNYIPAVLKKK